MPHKSLRSPTRWPNRSSLPTHPIAQSLRSCLILRNSHQLPKVASATTAPTVRSNRKSFEKISNLRRHKNESSHVHQCHRTQLPKAPACIAALDTAQWPQVRSFSRDTLTATTCAILARQERWLSSLLLSVPMSTIRCLHFRLPKHTPQRPLRWCSTTTNSIILTLIIRLLPLQTARHRQWHTECPRPAPIANMATVRRTRPWWQCPIICIRRHRPCSSRQVDRWMRKLDRVIRRKFRAQTEPEN